MSEHRPFTGGSAPEAIARERVGGLRSALRVTDRRTGRLVGVPSDRRVLLRVCVHLDCPDGRIALTDLRAALVGDVARRTAEVEGLQVVVALAVPDLDPEQAKLLDRAAAALAVQPPVAVVGPSEARTALQGPADVQLLAEGADAQEVGDGVLIGIGRALGDEVVEALARGDLDATTVRLALLGTPYRAPVALDQRALTEAGQALRDWRRQVAGWARSPSRPVPDEVRRQAGAALTGDLDTPAALALLRDVLATPGLEDGARFETFAAVDRVLGLELAREVGTL